MYSYMYSTPSTYVTLWVKFKPTGAKGEKIQCGQPWPLIQRIGSRSLNNLYSHSIGDVQCLIVLKGEKICYRQWIYTQFFYLDPWPKSQCTLLTHTHSMGEVWAQHGQREGEKICSGQGFSKG